MKFTDTHCHIHEENYQDSEAAYENAMKAGVERLLVVGTDVKSSFEAVQFADSHSNAWAIIGVHPHEAKRDGNKLKELKKLLDADKSKIVGIGEIGLDYYYNHSPREDQIKLLNSQIEIALEYDLPISFHVRDAFDDFWPIFRQYSGVRGVLHSYTDNQANLDIALSSGLYIGINGISTFTKNSDQRQLFSLLPLEYILLETDAPYLTPVPLRGNVNEPAFVVHVARHLADLRSINLEELSGATEHNATKLFFKQIS